MKGILKIHIFTILLLLISPLSKCQTFDNFQYYSSNMLLNPANTGNHEYEWRFYNHYFLNKTFLNGGYESFYLAADYNISLFPDKLSLGFYYKYENISSNPWDINHIYFSISYSKRFNKSGISIGLQPGLVHSSVDQSKLLFPDQYDRETGGFNFGASSQEWVWVEPKTYLLLNAGFLYTLFTNTRNYEFGVSVQSIGNNSDNFMQSDLEYVYSGFARTHYFINKLKIDPFLWANSTVSYFQTTAGVFIDYQVPKQLGQIKSITAGVSMAVKNNDYPDAAVIMAGLQWLRLSAFIQYKYPYSFGDNLVQEFNTFELGFVYNGFNANLNQYILPCDFY